MLDYQEKDNIKYYLKLILNLRLKKRIDGLFQEKQQKIIINFYIKNTKINFRIESPLIEKHPKQNDKNNNNILIFIIII